MILKPVLFPLIGKEAPNLGTPERVTCQYMHLKTDPFEQLQINYKAQK